MLLFFFAGENQQGKTMENGQLPGESVLAVTYGYLWLPLLKCTDTHEMGIHWHREVTKR